MEKSIVFMDTEVSTDGKKILDIGAVRNDHTIYHSTSLRNFCAFVSQAEYICGHNVIHHDLKYIHNAIGHSLGQKVIDTLYLSPLLFPKRPYHHLLKDDKLQTTELNNPVNDSIKAEQLFRDEVNAFAALSKDKKKIFYSLLSKTIEFKGFFDYIGFKPFFFNLENAIKSEYKNMFCANAQLSPLIKSYPIELAYALALISTQDTHSITPPWLLYHYPKIENVLKCLRNTPCRESCAYCQSTLDVHKSLNQIFGYSSFRTYAGKPLQENAARAAVEGKSLLAVFPTGGGKSITFQLPALMAGKSVRGLTVVISPLQSLMKDQVDNLAEIGITEAVTINGLLSPIERADACARVSDGSAALLYISPEQLRSRTIEKLLSSRNIVRFVIDEAHCFSAWGQDFRVDYLYIGDFIRKLQKQKTDKQPIPVSCFTATAKKKVISDICDYFKCKLDVDLEIFASPAARENLHYAVLYKKSDEEKYNALRDLIAQKNCPTIVYVSRTKRTRDIAEKLSSDGFPARPFNGQMDAAQKIANQEAFMRNEVKIIVATSAFGMGVDKKDVELVIHYDISDSLENYVQEAGRAGREPTMQAECYVLFNENDLDKHFILLNQTKLSISEIQQVWRAIKYLTKFRPNICCSPLEIARQAGWDDSVSDIETRVKTAVAALENAGYIQRGRNVPHVYATSILVNNMQEASFRIDKSPLFSPEQRIDAKRIMKSLISERRTTVLRGNTSGAENDDAESRVDYLADILGISKDNVVNAVNLMRQEGLLADALDMSAYILKSDTQNKSMQMLSNFAKLESFVISQISTFDVNYDLKRLNEAALEAGIASSSVKNIRTILYFLKIKNYIHTVENRETNTFETVLSLDAEKAVQKFHKRIEICRFVLEELFAKAEKITNSIQDETPVLFSLVYLFNAYIALPKFNFDDSPTTLQDVEDALLYLSKIGALKLEGGFLVLYNAMEIKRLVLDNKIRYKVDDYKLLNDFYKQKIRQIHIVGEYANLMANDCNAALEFVQDYFQMDFKKFLAKYFKGARAKEIDRNITPEKYHQLFDELSDIQSQIINDADSKYIVVAAGPGSGKTRVLVHKLAALLLLEDVKHEQLLMVTFSRAAATEFKKRLIALIGNAANFVEIKTFHSYCFDLLGKIGSLDGAEDVVKNAADMIQNGEVEPGKIVKSVLVIDEAQDMDENEYNLICALMQHNDDIRVIAVGDDDQNIYEFRGSNSKYLRAFIEEYGAVRYEMNENYRSKANIVALSNAFAASIQNRMKTGTVQSVQAENGIVQIIHHQSPHLAQAVVNNVKNSYQDGKACVLTSTNDEALQVLGLLLKNGIKAKLIQSLDGFRLYNLVEIRYFLKILDQKLQFSPVISDDLWNEAQQQTCTRYAASTCLEICRNLWADFARTYPLKYRSDLDAFIKESNYEDFYDNDKESVFVSTIHKSKGREFDTVYMLLNNISIKTDEEKRRLYVGMTRAKSALYIHCNTPIFSHIHAAGLQKLEDVTQYAEPPEISVQLTHKDVVLDYFKDRKNLLFKLRSGMPLTVSDIFLNAESEGRTVHVAKFSKARIAELNRLRKRGYHIYAAEVRFIVAWKGENDETETPVLLANLFLRKQNNCIATR